MIRTAKVMLLVSIIFSSVGLIYNYHRTDQLFVDLPLLLPKFERQIDKIKITDTIKRGETLSDLLSKNGISQNHIYPTIESFKQMYSVRKLKPGDNYEIEIDSAGNFYSFVYSPSLEKKYFIHNDGNGNFTFNEEKVALESRMKYLKNTIQTTLYDAILDAGEAPELLLMFTDIFQWDIDFFIDPRIGDQFKIIYEKLYLPGGDEFVRYGKILAAQYKFSGDTLTAFYFDNSPGDDGYYDLNGNSFQKTFLKSPLNYRRISSHFSYSRRHPILKRYRPHYGIDYAAPRGTPVSAAADGVVIDKGYDKGIGNFVKLRHKNARFVTLYGHLSKFGTGIKKGVRVKQKQVVGYVGRTGLATGPHLHYAFYDNGRPVNPLKIKNTSADPVLSENQHKFNSTRENMLSHLAKIEQINIPLILTTASQIHYNRYNIPKR